MNWVGSIIKGLVFATVPVKILDKGLDHAKNEIREEINHYGIKLKMMVVLGSAFMLTLVFISIAFAFVLGDWLNSVASGFAIISGVFLLVFTALFVAYKDKLQEK